MNYKVLGLVMAIVGFVMVLTNALAYIFGWDFKNTAFTVLGLAFVVIGMKRARQTK